MGNSIELGYYVQPGSDEFNVVRVRPFSGGSTYPADQYRYVPEFIDVVPQADPEEPMVLLDEFDSMRSPDDDGLVSASIDVTYNYSPRIMAITRIHLAKAVDERLAAEVSPVFFQLLTGLKDETPDFDDYFRATDGNIRHLAGTLLDWVFQHPDATFRSLD